MARQRWRIEVRRSTHWEKGWLELGGDGVVVRVAGQPLSPAEGVAVYARSLLARLVLLRHGWRLVGSAERSREDA